MGGLIHILLVPAIVMMRANFIPGRKRTIGEAVNRSNPRADSM
jgi:hypothetical protein